MFSNFFQSLWGASCALSAKTIQVFGFAVFCTLIVGGCATGRENSSSYGVNSEFDNPSNAEESAAAMHWVERLVVDDEVNEYPLSLKRLVLSDMTPIQLLVAASHFYDSRPAYILGCYDNGNGPDGLCEFWTVGDSIFFLFEWVFFEYKLDSVDSPAYLKSKDAALRWMISHSFRLTEMKLEYANDKK